MIGWIKLHRSLIDWEWWDDHNTTRLLTYLLCAVNYEHKKWKGIDVKPGQLVTSFPKLAERTGMSVKQVRLAMDKLVDSGEVAREKAREGQLITLTKWDKLQSKESEWARDKTDEKTDRGRKEGRKGATTKEGNNENKVDKKEDRGFNFKFSLLSLGVEEQVASDWLKVRAKKKASNTETAFNVIKSEIKKSSLPANECITEAVARSWTGFKAEWMRSTDQFGSQQTPTTVRSLPSSQDREPQFKQAAMERIKQNQGNG